MLLKPYTLRFTSVVKAQTFSFVNQVGLSSHTAFSTNPPYKIYPLSQEIRIFSHQEFGELIDFCY